MTAPSKSTMVSNPPLMDCTYIVFDLETTGGNPEANGLTEIFALRYYKGEIVDTFYTLVNPKRSIPPIVRKITGITNQMVRKAPSASEVMPQFLEFIGNDILVSHNTIGDLKFIQYFARKCCNVEVDNFFLCTHLLSEKLLPHAKDKSLTGLGAFLKLETRGEAHRADADGYLTLELFSVLRRELEKKNISTLHDAIRLQGDTTSALKLGWAIDAAQIKAVPYRPGVIRFLDRQNKDIFITACTDMGRSVKKLMSFEKLPKKLAKTLLASYHLKAEPCENFVQAVLCESRYLAEGKSTFDPALWHNRLVQGFYIRRLEKDTFSVGIGRFPEGGLRFFGPIYDRKEGALLLDALAKIFDLKVHRSRGLVFKGQHLALIESFFAGTLSSLKEELDRKLNSYRALIPTLKKRYSDELRLLDEIASLAKGSYRDLLNFHGLLALDADAERLWLYPVQNSLLEEPVKAAKPLHEWLKVSKFVSERFKASKIGKKRLKDANDLKTVFNINATLWFIYLAKKRGHDNSWRFFDPDDLRMLAQKE